MARAWRQKLFLCCTCVKLSTTCYRVLFLWLLAFKDNNLVCCMGSTAEQLQKVYTTLIYRSRSPRKMYYIYIYVSVCIHRHFYASISMHSLVYQQRDTVTVPPLSEHIQGFLLSLTDPRRNRMGTLVPNFSSRALTADSSWYACFPKSCKPPSESLGTAKQEALKYTKKTKFNRHTNQVLSPSFKYCLSSDNEIKYTLQVTLI